ncbi:MAG: FAD-dependent oxidoreductase [bacterium]|nr:MAG: FAD-dependent oxidoreductase [bacterium]
MKNPIKSVDCLIIGSGISGLMAGRILREAGLSVTLLDKGRGSGGRLASRRVGENEYPTGIVDYGAPSFSARSSLMQTIARQWEKDRIIKKWNTGPHNEEPQTYIGLTGMRSIAIHLTSPLHIIQSEKVTNLQQNSSWIVTTEKGDYYQSAALLLTPPVPQSLMLLHESRISISREALNQLHQVKYDRCLALFGLLDRPSKITPLGAFQGPDESIIWIADHQKRGISPVPTFTAHFNSVFSHKNWDTPAAEFISQVSPVIAEKLGSQLMTTNLHRWKFANARRTYPGLFFLQKKPLPLVLAGDGFGTGGIEGAVLSGMAAAEALLM